MSVDLSEFVRLSEQTGKHKRCKIGIALSELQGPRKAELEAALAADKLDISAGAIAKWCERRDLVVGHNAVRSHRARSCSCYDIAP